MRKFLILTFLLCLTKLFYAQNDYLSYFKLVSQAKKLKKQDKLDSSIIVYKLAFNKVDFIHSDNIFEFIRVCFKTKNYQLIKKYHSINKTQKKSIDFKYKSIIDSIAKEDQRVRSKEFYKSKDYYYQNKFDSTFIPNPKKFKNAELKMREWWKTDSSNVLFLRNLINKYGFPSEKKVGKYSYVSAIVILAHFDKDTSNIIMGEKLEIAFKNGDILPSDYAWIIDRHLSFAGKSQLYMSIPFGIEKLTLEQKNSINLNRVSIGLTELEGIKIKHKKNGSVTVTLDN